MKKEKVAIVGSGIAGLGSAYFLYKDYDITIFEKNDRAGGHAYTVTVDDDGKELPIDTAVMIHNQANYPYICRLLKTLDVQTRQFDSTISFQHLPSNLEYTVPHLKTLFAQRGNMLSLTFYSLVREMLRFGKIAQEVLTDERFAEMTVAEYARERHFSKAFLHKYLLPIAAALWSADPSLIEEFPVVTLVRYFKNHHLLGPLASPGGPKSSYAWRSFVGGTKVYRDKLIALFPDALHLDSPVKSVRRLTDRVEVTTKNGKVERFDKVIFACHADEALALLADPSQHETEVLGAFQYKTNSLTLHTDASVMPKNRRAWASFNCRVAAKGNEIVAEQNYYLNDLQQLPTKNDYFMAIGNDEAVDPKKVLGRYTFSHPISTVASSKAQDRMDEINTGRSYFCGSYTRYAFHEDAFVSALNVARKITGSAKLWGDTPGA